MQYTELLREHISKEDGILYPLAERVIPDPMQGDILEGFREAEAGKSADFCEHYREIVERYEGE
jgi:hemerythrin-like domain-containing protein